MAKNNSTVNFEKIQIFYFLCELQSFSLVAKKLKVQQSYVSRAIQDLERLMNRKLILNNQKPIMLTEDGKKLYELTKKINLETLHIEEILFSENNKFTSFVKIFLSLPISVSILLTDDIKQLFKNIPELGLDISFINTITMDLFSKNDIVIAKDPIDHVLIDSTYIGSYEMCFGISEKYITKHGFPQAAHFFPYHNFLFVEDHYYKNVMPESVRNFVSTKYTIENEFASYKAIEEGVGIGIIPKFIAPHLDEVIAFELEEKLHNLTLYVATSKLKRNHYVSLVLEFLKHSLSKLCQPMQFSNIKNEEIKIISNTK